MFTKVFGPSKPANYDNADSGELDVEGQGKNHAAPSETPTASDADDELAETVYALCETRDNLNTELAGLNDLLAMRLKELEEEEKSAAGEVAELKALIVTLESNIASVQASIPPVRLQLETHLGPARYQAWLASQGSALHQKPTLPAGLKGSRGNQIKNAIATGDAGTRARRIRGGNAVAGASSSKGAK
ncbi:hypothetical protein C8R46DRAFT_1307861 [Mycena filopes]|nr:hypothetical protein C8R46DRAFT_1307861 [Mycena filopes]